jgi:hypothetical protein
MAKAKQDLESQFFGEETIKRVSVQELELADQLEVSEDETLFFNEDGTMGRSTKATKRLEGAAAMEFLNLPPRQYNRLRKGDLSRIRWKFKDLFELWIKENKRGRNENKLFWDQIRVRVINKTEAGKPTRGVPSLGIEPGVNNGQIFSGEAIKTFLPETKYSNAGDQYILQLLSIVVTEELESV